MHNPNENKTPAVVIHLRAFIAYCEGQATSENPFTLIPSAAAITAGIPFSTTFSHEGNDWAVFIAGDCSPHDTIALEQAGVIDDADDARQEITGGGYTLERFRLDYAARVSELAAWIPGRTDALDNAETSDEIMQLLTGVLRTRFYEDVIPCPYAVNLEDRENALAVLERAENFGLVDYSREFLRLAPYILYNITPSA